MANARGYRTPGNPRGDVEEPGEAETTGGTTGRITVWKASSKTMRMQMMPATVVAVRIDFDPFGEWAVMRKDHPL